MGRPENKREVTEPRNVSLYPRHWVIIEKYADEINEENISATLRRIVTEWAQFKAQQLPLPMSQS